MRAPIVFVALLAVAAPAAAHVTIVPRSADAGGFQEYTVRVPTEKDVPTTQVRLVFPQGFEVLRFRPPAPGWKYEVERDASGRITGVTWSGNTISREEYELFNFMARSRMPGVYKIDAFQTYNGDEVVGWVDPEEPRPAPKVTINPKPAAPDGADAFAATPTAGAAAAAPEGAKPSGELGTWLGGGAAVLALASLVVSLKASRSR